jgi:hypothetical protein
MLKVRVPRSKPKMTGFSSTITGVQCSPSPLASTRSWFSMRSETVPPVVLAGSGNGWTKLLPEQPPPMRAIYARKATQERATVMMPTCRGAPPVDMRLTPRQ